MPISDNSCPRTLITPKTFPPNSLPEFIAYVRANQATAKFGSAGAGSASYISCVLLNAALGVEVAHVPYRGLGPAMQDLIAGRIDYLCDSPSTSLAQIEGNFVKVLATTGPKRSASLPQVPTAREQGLPFDVIAWQAIFLPKQTPDPIVERLARAISETLDTPSVRDRFASVGEEVTAPERTVEPLRHRQTKEADNRYVRPTATAPHLDSTRSSGLRRRTNSVAIEGIADIRRSLTVRRSDANDPGCVKTPKSRKRGE